MRLFLGVFLPWLAFFTIKRPISGLFCLFMQLTIVGWIPAAIWSVSSVSQYNNNRNIERITKLIDK